MTLDKNSLIIKIFLPIIIVITIIFSTILVLIYKIVKIVEQENIKLFSEQHNYAIRKILDRSLTEIMTIQMTHEEIPNIIEIKKADVIEEIKFYCQKKNLQVSIITHRDTNHIVEYSNIDILPANVINNYVDNINYGIVNNIAILNVRFPAWNWSITLVSKLSAVSETQKYIKYILPINLSGVILLIFTLWHIFRKQISRPFKNMIYAINKGEFIKSQNITEIDVLGKTINQAMNDLTMQNQKLKRFQKVIDSSFNSIIITNSRGEITYVNTAFEMLTGYQRDEVIGKKPNILKSGEHNEEFYAQLWRTITNGQIWKGEFINKKKNGAKFIESAVIFPVSFEGEINYVAVKIDITQEKKLYEQLIRAQKMEAIGTLAGGIAHDFNNILTAILGYSELMLHTMSDTDKFYKPAKIINDSAKKAAELTKKILSIARKEKLEVKPMQINEIIKDVIDIAIHSIPKNIEIVSKLSDDIPTILADPAQIHQVILNLCVNARDAMPEGGVLTIETSLYGSTNGATSDILKLEGDFIKITVSDTGIGMSADIAQKVFDPFFTTKDRGRGTGLGLYIVHTIVTNHNGYINIYSEPQKGTRFNVYLPITKHQSTVEVQSDEQFVGSGTILVIDDEDEVRNVCKEILVTLGYEVITANDGMKGIQQYVHHKDVIKAVILDMIMPRMGGNEVYKTLKEIDPSVQVIISSGFTQEGFAGIDRLIKDGAVGFVQKPFTLNTLKAILKQIK